MSVRLLGDRGELGENGLQAAGRVPHPVSRRG
jgi:hypothetical protein